jgi:hypothetical protein
VYNLSAELVGAACGPVHKWPLSSEQKLSITFQHCSVGFELELGADVITDVGREEELEAILAEIGVDQLESFRVFRVDSRIYFGVGELAFVSSAART